MSDPLKVLVVDDDRDGADGLADLVSAFGHETRIAYSGKEAVTTFAEDAFDITFMDVRMPEMNGVEAFLEIRKLNPDAQVVLVTGFSVEELLQQAIDNGVRGILRKPVDMREIVQTLESLNGAS